MIKRLLDWLFPDKPQPDLTDFSSIEESGSLDSIVVDLSEDQRWISVVAMYEVDYANYNITWKGKEYQVQGEYFDSLYIEADDGRVRVNVVYA